MASQQEEKKYQGDGKGFAGLSSMVSDVDSTLASTSKNHPREAPSSSTQQPVRVDRREQPIPTKQSHKAPEQPEGGSSVGKWLFGMAAVFGVIWIVNQSDDNSSSNSSYSRPSSSTPIAQTPTKQQPVAKQQIASRPLEVQPSIGQNNVLSTAEIRYCLAEEIRLDAAKSVINNYAESDVDRFNAYVNDYNSRCSAFRYRQGALERAQRDVEPYRSILQTEGRDRFVTNVSATERSKTTSKINQSSRQLPDPGVQAIQELLNLLEYKAGAEDGLYGSSTQAAIRKFQLDNDLKEDGLPSKFLFEHLMLALEEYTFTLDLVVEQMNLSQSYEVTQTSDTEWKVLEGEKIKKDTNWKICIDGRFPRMCKKSLLRDDQVTLVDAAQRKANLNRCLEGAFPKTCNRSLLTASEANQVDLMELKVNFDYCIKGRSSIFCDYSLLTAEEIKKLDETKLNQAR